MLPFSATADDCRVLFAKVGDVGSVKVITDAIAGRSREFSFVEMISEAHVNKAIAEVQGSELMEKTIIVSGASTPAAVGRGDFDGGRDSFGKERLW